MDKTPGLYNQKIPIAFEFPVIFGDRVFSTGNSDVQEFFKVARVADSQKVACFIDANLLVAFPNIARTVTTYFENLIGGPKLVTEPIIWPGGEQLKNRLDLVEQIYRLVLDFDICRHSYLMAIGGGTLLDIVGYGAATSHRGIRMVRVPTTVLAQSDSAHGVKTSMNFLGKKNFVGTFTPPAAVICDYSFLEGLPERFFITGFSESLKVALLKDLELLDFIERNGEKIRRRDRETCTHVIYKCARHHLDHIAGSGDPFEYGSSRPLDFGHWAAHKLEQMSNFEITHGESVSVGVALDITYSYVRGYLSCDDWTRALRSFVNLGLPIFYPLMLHKLDQPQDSASILHGLEEFRQHLGGRLTIMLLERLGRGFEVSEIDLPAMQEAALMVERFVKSGG